MEKVPHIYKKWLLWAWMAALLTLLEMPFDTLHDDDWGALKYGYPTVTSEAPDNVRLGVYGWLTGLYTRHSGRVAMHVATQAFVRCHGYFLLPLTVALLTLACIELMARLAFRRPANRQRLLTMLAFLVIMPWFGMNGRWFGSVSFALNYSLAGALNLWVLYRLAPPGPPLKGGVSLWVTVLGALVAGSLHEGFAVAFGAGLLYLLWKRPDRRYLWLVTVAYLVGAVLVCLSPANFARVQTRLGLYERLQNLYSIAPALTITLIMLIICLWWRKRNGGVGVFFIILFFNFLFCALVVTFEREAYMLIPMALMLVIIAARAVGRFALSMRVTCGLIAGVTAMVLMLWSQGMRHRRAYEAQVAEYLETGVVKVPADVDGNSGWGPFRLDPTDSRLLPRKEPANLNDYFFDGALPLRYLPEYEGVIKVENVPVDVEVEAYATDYVPTRLFPRLLYALRGHCGEPASLVTGRDGETVYVYTRDDLTPRTIIVKAGSRNVEISGFRDFE